MRSSQIPTFSSLAQPTANTKVGEEEAEAEEEEEDNYASRKLMIRQMQGMIAKQQAEAANSEYDSWSDLEENFARAYEPIPLHINMETWRVMSKRDILKTVRSRRMRKELEYLTHSEILGKIEVLQRNAKRLSSRFGVDHLLPHMDHIIAAQAQVHREERDRGQAEPPRQQQQQQVRFVKAKSKKRHDSWSSRASSILNNPESIYVSREEVLKNLQNEHGARLQEQRNPGGREMERVKRRQLQQQQQQPPQRQQRHRHEHGSWSSRASSILASNAQKEPNYMSRAEILENLADAAYDALSRNSSSNLDSESDASTVKSVILNKKRPAAEAGQQQQQKQEQRPTPGKAPDYMGESDTCSCTSCEMYYSGDDDYCSCCNGDYGEYGEYGGRGNGIYGGGNLTYTKETREPPAGYAEPERRSARSQGSSNNPSVVDGGKSRAAAGRDKGKRNGSNASSNEAAAQIMSRDKRSSEKGEKNSSSSSSEAAAARRLKRFSQSSSSSISDSKKVSTKTTSAASSFSSQSRGSRRRRSQEGAAAVEMSSHTNQQRVDLKFPPKTNYAAAPDDDVEQIYRAVGVGEIQRQKNERVLRRHLRDLASDWNRSLRDQTGSVILSILLRRICSGYTQSVL